MFILFHFSILLEFLFVEIILKNDELIIVDFVQKRFDFIKCIFLTFDFRYLLNQDEYGSPMYSTTQFYYMRKLGT